MSAQTKEAYYTAFQDEEGLYAKNIFYYDNQRNQRSNTYLLPTNGGKLDGICVAVETYFIFDRSFADYTPKNTSHWFEDFFSDHVVFQGMENLNTSEVTDMSYMFHGMKGVTIEIDLSHFDTSMANDMSYMFADIITEDKLSEEEFSLDLSSFIFKSSTNTTKFLKDVKLKSLTIPASANNLAPDAFEGVDHDYEYLGDNPCELIAPEGFNPQGVTPYEGYIGWKGGKFYYTDFKVAYCRTSDFLNTLYYDNQCNSWSEYDFMLPDNGGKIQSYIYIDYCGEISIFKFDSSFADYRPTNTSHWFENMGGTPLLEGNEFYIEGLENLNTSEVSNMSYMFYNSTYRYYEDANLDLILSHFDTSNVTDMSYMFAGFTIMKTWDAENEYTFTYTKGALDISSFTINPSTNTDYMFKDAEISTLVIPASANYLASNACSGVGTASAPCTLIYPDGFSIEGAMQYYGYFTWKGGYFMGTAPIVEAYVVLSTDYKTLTFYYDRLRATRGSEGTTYVLPTRNDEDPSWLTHRTTITKAVFDSSFKDARPKVLSAWFYEMMSLASIENIEYLNTSQATQMEGMFCYCESLTNLDLSHFDTSNVTSMNLMFARCTGLEKLDLRSFTFTSTGTYAAMLLDCSSLKGLVLPATANYLPDEVFSGVGTPTNPCVLINDGFTLEGATQQDGYFEWKGGCFKDAVKEPYALLSTDGKTLTFFYDNRYIEREGMVISLQDLSNVSLQNFSRANVENVTFDPSFADARPTSCVNWFYRMQMTSLSEISGIENLNTSEVTSMSGMFYLCNSLTTLDLSHFNTSKVTDMSNMFFGCPRLSSIDLSHFDTSKVTSMFSMFFNCRGLTSLDLTSFDTSNVENMAYMFWSCTGLTGIDVSHFDTSSLSSISYMFQECSNLESIDISNFTFTPNIVNGSEQVFSGCSKLSKLTVSETAAYLDNRAFDAASASIPCLGTPENPCTLIYPAGMELVKDEETDTYFKWKGGYFMGTALIVEAYVVLSTDYKTLTFYYDDQRGSREGTVYELNEEHSNPAWLEGGSQVTSVSFDASFADARPTNCYTWFTGMNNLEQISGLQYLNTSQVTSMFSMFYQCEKLTDIDLSHFDTSNVTTMSLMFTGCTGLTSLDLSAFTFKSSSYQAQMIFLSNCTNLKTLTIPVSANYLSPDAFDFVGSAENPCILFYPEDFTLEGAEQDDGYFVWKGGKFKEALSGDANGDGTTTVADVMLTVNRVMNKPLSVFIERNADVNGDGKITVADVMAIVKMVLNSGPKSSPRNAYQSMSDAMAVTAKGSELTLHLTGTGTYTALQMMLSLPEGCRLESARMVSSRSNGHSVQTSDLGNGQYRVVVYGASGLPFGNSCSDLVRLNVKGNHNGDVAVSDIQVVDYLTNTFLLSDVSGIATGIDSIGSDASDDGDWYTTQGQKVTTPTRGVYIRNGKKVVVR